MHSYFSLNTSHIKETNFTHTAVHSTPVAALVACLYLKGINTVRLLSLGALGTSTLPKREVIVKKEGNTYSSKRHDIFVLHEFLAE